MRAERTRWRPSKTCRPRPPIPPFEPRPLPSAITDSGRRILWIVGVYRAVCGAVLLGLALLLDLRGLNVATPNAFVTGDRPVLRVRPRRRSGGCSSERLPMPLQQMLFALLIGDVFFLALVMIAGGSTGAPLPILLFPQLAASGWLLRTRTAFFHAAFATVMLLGLEAYRVVEGNIGGARRCSRPGSSASATSRRSASPWRSAATPRCRRTSPSSAASTSRTSSRSTA